MLGLFGLAGLSATAARAADEPAFFVRPQTLFSQAIAELGGAPAKVLSRNEATGRLALEVSVPAGFRDRGPVDSDGRSVEIVVLEGSVQFGGEVLSARDFGYSPAGLPRPHLGSIDGARLLVFFDPAPRDPVVAEKLRTIGRYVTRYGESRWNPGTLSQSSGFDLKLEIQHLKKDPLSGARTWMVRLEPPIDMPFEVHSVPEEAYLIEGKYAQPECMPDGLRTGVYEAGDYFYRPAGIAHSGPGSGPIETTTWVMRTPADLDVTFYRKCENGVMTQRVGAPPGAPSAAPVQSLLLRAALVTYDLERSLLFYRDILGQTVVEDVPLDAARSASWLAVGPNSTIRFVVLRGSGEYPGGPITGGRIAFLAVSDPERPTRNFRRPNRYGVHGDVVLPHRVQNLDKIHVDLRAAGFEVLFAPRTSSTGRSRNMMVYDPNGHIVELFELP